MDSDPVSRLEPSARLPPGNHVGDCQACHAGHLAGGDLIGLVCPRPPPRPRPPGSRKVPDNVSDRPVNETFSAAWRHWDRRPADGELLSWLHAIARNAVRDELRSADRRSRHDVKGTAILTG